MSLNIDMTIHPDAEDMRSKISSHLSKILMLFGRLTAEYNARYLPVTVTSILYLVHELEQLEKVHSSFSSILKENIERRDKHLNVFSVPEMVKKDPSARGLRKALYESADPLIEAYCREERSFLEGGLNPQVSKLIRSSLLMRSEKNCKLLATLCKAENCKILEDFARWCHLQLSNLN